MGTITKQTVIDYIDGGLERYNGKRWLNEEAVAFIKTIQSRVGMIEEPRKTGEKLRKEQKIAFIDDIIEEIVRGYLMGFKDPIAILKTVRRRIEFFDKKETDERYKAVRFNSTTGIPSIVNVDFKLEKGVLYVTKGGSTGFESVYLSAIEKDLKNSDVFDVWVACMGTNRSWHKLEIPLSEIQRFITDQKVESGSFFEET